MIVRGIERKKIFRPYYDRQFFLDWIGELILPYRDRKQHIRLYVKRLGERISVDWRNLHRSNRWLNQMIRPFLLCCLPVRKADDTSSPALSVPCGSTLQLHALRIAYAVNSTLAKFRL